MLDRVIELWKRTTFQDKIALAKRIAIQGIVIFVVGVVFFWATFLFTWTLALFIGIQPYHQTFNPNFHVRNVMPDKLLTIFVNQNMKWQACELGQSDPFFSQLTVPYHEYCNIEQYSLPGMRAPVDISISNVDIQKISFVSGCIKHKGKQISCQKYPSSYSLTLFRNVNFYQLYYLQIELHLKKTSQPDSIHYTPTVQFDQNCWFITKIVKNYYNFIMLIFSSTVTFLLTLGILLIRVIKILEKSNQIVVYERQEKQVKKMTVPASVLKKLNTQSAKMKESSNAASVVPQKDHKQERKLLKQQSKAQQSKAQQNKQRPVSMIKKDV